MTSALHFVGFNVNPSRINPHSDIRYDHAVTAFGQPDFIHKIWDGRAKSMITDDDIVVFADNINIDTPTQKYSYDDSQYN